MNKIHGVPSRPTTSLTDCVICQSIKPRSATPARAVVASVLLQQFNPDVLVVNRTTGCTTGLSSTLMVMVALGYFVAIIFHLVQATCFASSLFRSTSLHPCEAQQPGA